MDTVRPQPSTFRTITLKSSMQVDKLRELGSDEDLETFLWGHLDEVGRNFPDGEEER